MGLRLFDPDFQLSQHRQAVFVPANFAFRIAAGLEVAFDTLKLVDQVQRDISAPRLAFGLYFLSIDEFAPRMCPAA